MDVALATVSLISLTMAFAMGIVTWRLMREERRRSDARVAALMADLERAGERDTGRDARAASSLDVPPPIRTTAPAPPRRRPVQTTPAARPTRSTRPEVPLRTPLAGSPTGFFATVTGSPALLRRFVATVSAAVVVLAALSVIMLSGGAPTDPGVGTPVPVELLSLAHTREGEYLAITGSIRNPSGGVARGQISVMATVFDRDGTVVGTGQTPLPVAVLLPGSETAFIISLPDGDQIDRYRISFMQGQTSVPHIDRRQPGDQARSAALRGDES